MEKWKEIGIEGNMTFLVNCRLCMREGLDFLVFSVSIQWYKLLVVELWKHTSRQAGYRNAKLFKVYFTRCDRYFQVLCAVYGPHEARQRSRVLDDRCIINCQYSMATFSTNERKVCYVKTFFLDIGHFFSGYFLTAFFLLF